MKLELADIARSARALPPLEGEITSAEATPSKRELNFRSYNLLNVDSKDQDTPWYTPTVKCVSFPMKVVGDVFYVGDGVTSVVGDAEIPSGTTVDATLVVKGNFRSGENCRLLKDVKALKNIVIGPNTAVEGNLVAGGKITLGSGCVVYGEIKSEGDIEIGEYVIIEEQIRSNSSIVLGQFTKVLRTVYAAKGLFAPRAKSHEPFL
ncbi:MAG: hypothetical protein JSV20_07220 [Candidatus Bathyarchaeota archaeon]|nr:MAG: hypothetical protein JSV20_07220 [Candidatus Bathyarchaeota archaeon]